jgi:NADPH:quinone reductase
MAKYKGGSSMRAMIMKQPGPAENFELKEVEKPKILSGHILVAVKATSVNPVDTKVRGGPFPFAPEFPAILHIDFSGIVAEVPPDEIRFKVGDKVYGVGGGIKGMHGGALAEYLLIDADLAAPMPSHLSFAEAATLPLVSITSWEALVDKLEVQPNDKLLIHGGLGGVGHIAAQLGKSLGAVVYTTVSKDEDMELSKTFGAHYVINYKIMKPSEYVASYTDNQGFDAIFDTVGGANIELSFQAAKYNGSIASIQTKGSYDLNLMYAKGLSLHSVLMLIPLFTGKDRAHFGDILREVKKLVEEGKIKPLLHPKIFNWKEVAEAHKLVESKQQKGKVAIVIEE